MEIRFNPSAPAAIAARVIPVSPGTLEARLGGLAEAGLLQAAARDSRFEGKAGQLFEAFVAGEGGIATRLVLLGTGADGGDAAAPEHGPFEQAGGTLVARYLSSGVEAVAVDASALSPEEAAALALGARLRAWRHDRWRTTLAPTARPSLKTVEIVGAAEGSEAAWQPLAALAEGIALTRELVSEPANIIYPESFVERCRPLADHGVTIRVLDEKAMYAAGMGALLGVAQGSVRPPRLLVMEWKGEGADDGPPVVLVGKGVTFDTGGISIKPAAGMEDMKWDMGGAGAVAGAMLTLALRKARAHVVGICGLVENMPDGNAQRPGDVVTSMSGKTVEVINTDAEGRLVLCDAITWAQQTYKPKTIVDLATLTGAMIIALGDQYGGLFANDDTLAEELVAAGRASGDRLWRFPLGKAYDKLIDSPIADIKNVGPRNAGSITAAQFIQRFVDDGVAWAHCDIAGMVWADKPSHLWDKGATGYGVRLLDRFVAARYER